MVSASRWRLFGAHCLGAPFSWGSVLLGAPFSWGSHGPSDTVPLLDVDDLLLLSPVFKPLLLRGLL